MDDLGVLRDELQSNVRDSTVSKGEYMGNMVLLLSVPLGVKAVTEGMAIGIVEHYIKKKGFVCVKTKPTIEGTNRVIRFTCDINESDTHQIPTGSHSGSCNMLFFGLFFLLAVFILFLVCFFAFRSAKPMKKPPEKTTEDKQKELEILDNVKKTLEKLKNETIDLNPAKINTTEAETNKTGINTESNKN